MKKVYIIGKVTGEDPTACRKKFNERALLLEKSGYKAIIPLDLVSETDTWHEAMRKCIREMLVCEGVSPLPDTWQSAGGMMEFNISQRLKMLVVLPTIEAFKEFKEFYTIV